MRDFAPHYDGRTDLENNCIDAVMDTRENTEGFEVDEELSEQCADHL